MDDLHRPQHACRNACVCKTGRGGGRTGRRRTPDTSASRCAPHFRAFWTVRQTFQPCSRRRFTYVFIAVCGGSGPSVVMNSCSTCGRAPGRGLRLAGCSRARRSCRGPVTGGGGHTWRGSLRGASEHSVRWRRPPRSHHAAFGHVRGHDLATPLCTERDCLQHGAPCQHVALLQLMGRHPGAPSRLGTSGCP